MLSTTWPKDCGSDGIEENTADYLYAQAMEEAKEGYGVTWSKRTMSPSKTWKIMKP